jgi:hypothetical protein
MFLPPKFAAKSLFSKLVKKKNLPLLHYLQFRFLPT